MRFEMKSTALTSCKGSCDTQSQTGADLGVEVRRNSAPVVMDRDAGPAFRISLDPDSYPAASILETVLQRIRYGLCNDKGGRNGGVGH